MIQRGGISPILGGRFIEIKKVKASTPERDGNHLCGVVRAARKNILTQRHFGQIALANQASMLPHVALAAPTEWLIKCATCNTQNRFPFSQHCWR
jgi:hypothetical protein